MLIIVLLGRVGDGLSLWNDQGLPDVEPVPATEATGRPPVVKDVARSKDLRSSIVMTSPMRGRNQAGVPQVPTRPTGFAVAAYPEYAQAQAAVEYLVKSDFSVEDLTIVGSDLQMVERVTGRLSVGKVAAAGAASGAWLGVFVGMLMGLFSQVAGGVLLLIVVSAAIGAAFGALMGWLGYSVAKGRRDFTSASQVVAQRYDVLCQPKSAEQARTMLSRMELGRLG